MSKFLRTLFLLALPLTTLATELIDPTTNTQIVPFNTLPACAQKCGKLFDVAYSCIPPKKPAPDTSCFCANADTKAVGQPGAANTCAAVCPVAADLTAIQTWYNGLCASGGTTPTTPDSGSNGGTTGGDTGTGTGDSSGSGDGSTTGDENAVVPKKKTWIEAHYQYVIMIVIIVLAIVFGWIAAAFFRRRYLRKRELNYEMRPPTAPWVTGHTGPTGPYGGNGGGFGDSGAGKEAAMMTTPMTASQVKKEKKKWFVGERT
ncbi:hypothetical protein V495_05305 [Pseudogymnoascus sp. VKM F-4514 (FW-929)]|nr:hypothetical protein V490_06504 [Pseudogymnoascus sp. VKM F-3557]KFY40676.1 hypothetical protein V495_05305 [Pseudogymnoascus sp. VKM F-4514 (FW-929)]KFY55335.1 hypothetical protein V497_07074 [Pseudogymnoascus sp. VKM F-4516 (FW-969)]